MNSGIEAAIAGCEERLQRAMTESDVAVLDELIAPDLMFTNHMGQVVSKEDDLGAHREGLLKIDGMMPSERRIVALSDDVAVVSVLMRISGSYMGTPVGGAFRYTRVWKKSESGKWRIVAGHSSVVQ
jgi:ketosteroid isomerase-like protein